MSIHKSPTNCKVKRGRKAPLPLTYQGTLYSNKKSIPFPKSLWTHHLIGAGATVEPGRTDVSYMSPYEAWSEIGFADFTNIVIPGIRGSLITYDLLDTGRWTWKDSSGPITCVRHDVAMMFNWAPKFARGWIASLVGENLMTPALAEEITGQIKDRRVAGQRRPIRPAIPSADRRVILAKTSGKCVYCAVSLTTEAGLPNSYHVDHVLPVIKGGADDIANLVPACATCNSSKRAKTLLMIATEKGDTP